MQSDPIKAAAKAIREAMDNKRPAPGWNGTLDRGETKRAIEAAERRMANG